MRTASTMVTSSGAILRARFWRSSRPAGPDKDYDALVAYLDELEGQERIQYENAEQRAEGSFSDPAQQG